MKDKRILFVFFVAIVIVSGFHLLNSSSSKDTPVLADMKERYDDRKDRPTFTGSFEEYSVEKLGLAGSRKVVLFFNASWCPTCSQFVDEIKKIKVPDNVLILSVDYDKYQDLRQKYKVAYQHTFVEVDKNGAELYRWSGGGLDRLKKELDIE